MTRPENARDRWLRCRTPRPRSHTVLVCFPHAGGSASAYLAWTPLLPPGVELRVVQYPGREDRFGLTPPTGMDALVAGALPEIEALEGRRLALFGHSMGGAAAHETVRRLHARGRRVHHLFVSGRQPPQHHRGGDLHTRDDDALLSELARLDPDNREVLAQRELMALMLPAIRADYRLIETYDPVPAPPLDCPITALVGDADDELTPAEAADWKLMTTGGADVHTFEGNHFFVASRREDVVALVVRVLVGGGRW